MRINKYILQITLVLALVLVSFIVEAQCPMCRMSAESNLANGGSEGAGLNRGILYLLSLPYLLVLFLGMVWYRSKKNNRENIQ